MTRDEALIVLKRINYHAEYEEYDAIQEAIRCIELVCELKWALSKCNPCTEYVKYDDGYIEHCYFCGNIGNDSHRNDCRYKELIKKAKGEE